jgi:hypothetical protein
LGAPTLHFGEQSDYQDGDVLVFNVSYGSGVCNATHPDIAPALQALIGQANPSSPANATVNGSNLTNVTGVSNLTNVTFVSNLSNVTAVVSSAVAAGPSEALYGYAHDVEPCWIDDRFVNTYVDEPREDIDLALGGIWNEQTCNSDPFSKKFCIKDLEHMYNIKKCPPPMLEYGEALNGSNATVWKYLGEPWWLKYCGFNGRNFSNDTGMNISTHVKLFPPVAFNYEEMLGHQVSLCLH